MAEEIKEFTINPAEIRTMQKDIARLQREGPPAKEEVAVLEPKVPPSPVEAPPPLAPPAPAEIEKKREEEARKRAEEERQRIEREQEAKEETLRKTEEERAKKGEEERKIELRKRIEEEKRQRIEALRRTEEQRKRVIEQEKEQERKAVEEIRSRAKEKAKKEKIDPRLLKEKKVEIKRQIKSLRARKTPLEQKRNRLFLQKNELEKTLKPILAQERKVENKIRFIEKKEKAAKSFRERQAIEKTRWETEEERKEIEVKRWEKEKIVQKIEFSITEINFEIEEILNEIRELKEKLARIKKKEDKIRMEKEKAQIEKKITELRNQEIQPLQSEKAKFLQSVNEAEKRLTGVANREQEVEKEKERIETQESLTQNLEEKREIEKQRWEIEGKRKKIEIQRWQVEKEKEKIELLIKDIELKLNHALKKEENLKKRIDEINAFLASIQPPSLPEKTLEVEKKLTLKKIKLPPPPQVREPLPQKLEEAKKEVPEVVPEKTVSETSLRTEELIGAKRIKEKREELEAEEREKKLKKVAEIKEKLLKIQQKEEGERREFLEKIKTQEKEGATLKPPGFPKVVGSREKEIVFRPLPEKLSTGEKLWVRLVILFSALILLGGVITFWYWYVKIRPAEAPAGPSPPAPIEQSLVIPDSLIQIESLPLLEISFTDEVPALIFQTINADLAEEQVFRVLINDLNKNEVLGLKEFLNAFAVKTPETFYEKLNNDFTLFVHSAPIGNRLGFVALIENQENLADLLTSWEASIEDDTAELFVALGKQEKAMLPYFKSGWYRGIPFRCQPFSRQDLGVCWAIMNDKFTWTTSWNTMEKVIEIIYPD